MIPKMGGMDLHTYGMADECTDRWMDVKMDGQIPPVFYRTSLPLGSLPKNTRHQPILSRLLLSGHLHEMPDSVQLLLRDVIYLRCHRS